MFGRKTQRQLDRLNRAYMDLADRYLAQSHTLDAAIMGVALLTCRDPVAVRDMAGLIEGMVVGPTDPTSEAAEAQGRADAVLLLMQIADGIEKGRAKASHMVPPPSSHQ